MSNKTNDTKFLNFRLSRYKNHESITKTLFLKVLENSVCSMKTGNCLIE